MAVCLFHYDQLLGTWITLLPLLLLILLQLELRGAMSSSQEMHLDLFPAITFSSHPAHVFYVSCSKSNLRLEHLWWILTSCIQECCPTPTSHAIELEWTFICLELSANYQIQFKNCPYVHIYLKLLPFPLPFIICMLWSHCINPGESLGMENWLNFMVA